MLLGIDEIVIKMKQILYDIFIIYLYMVFLLLHYKR